MQLTFINFRKILNETKTDQQDFFFFSNQQLIEYDENEHLNKFIDEIKEKVLFML